MGVTTSQQISRYYDLYRDKEIIFSKEFIKALSLDPRQVYIKCDGAQWPCIINSTSFIEARIIVGTRGGAFARISKDSPAVSLRFSFNQPDKKQLSFFVNARVTKVALYMNSQELAIITLSFTQRPPDDMIEIIGRLLEANQNAVLRREERIVITDDSKHRLGINKDETIVFVQNVPRHCILRDLSFSGAKVVLLGLAQFLKNKDVVLRIDFEEPQESVGISGAIVATEEIEGRKDLVAISIRFNDNAIPMAYKIHINDYITTIRQKQLNVVSQTETENQLPKTVVQGKSGNLAQGSNLSPLSGTNAKTEQENPVKESGQNILTQTESIAGSSSVSNGLVESNTEAPATGA